MVVAEVLVVAEVEVALVEVTAAAPRCTEVVEEVAAMVAHPLTWAEAATEVATAQEVVATTHTERTGPRQGATSKTRVFA